MSDHTPAALKLAAALLDDVDLDISTELPPFARFWGEPTIRYAHLAGPRESAGEVAAWTCDKDGFEYLGLPAAEAAFLFEGVAKLTGVDGTETVVRAGEGYRLPAGWAGRFEALEPVRKVFFLL